MDKQDELAVVVRDARFPNVAAHLRPAPDVTDVAIALAVRSFMGSDEVVEAAVMAMDRLESDEYWSDEGVKGHQRKLARAALSAAIGEGIGGGRG